MFGFVCVCVLGGGWGRGFEGEYISLAPSPALPRSTAMTQTSVYNKPSIESATAN